LKLVEPQVYVPESRRTMNSFELLATRAKRAGAPTVVTLQVTDRCNYECVHCYQEHDARADELSILGELADAGVLFVCFMGGEFFMRRDADELLRIAHDLGFAIRVKTTGHHIHDRRADLLASLRPLEVDLSLYAGDPQVHEEVTQHPGSWERTVAAARRLIARGVTVTLRCPTMDINAGAIAGLDALAAEIGARASVDPKITAREDASLEPVALRMNAETLRVFYQESAAHHLAQQWAGFDGCSGTRAGHQVNALDEAPCNAASGTIGIDPQGQVWPCNTLPVPAGDLRRQSFREIWYGETLEEVRALTWASLAECNVCPVRTYCSRCHAMALIEDGAMRGPSLEACRHAVAVRDALRARGVVPETDTALPPTWHRVDLDGQHHRKRRPAGLRVVT
jgi:radical SAM protein with 4Fe4S-binding SPASM domain